MNTFIQEYNYRKEIFEKFFFDTTLEEIKSRIEPKLFEAMYYSLKAGGKKFRPVLLLSTSAANSQNGFNRDALYLASCVECIHTYSLIHDDLPSMDNDDYRRGLLTCHKKFDEATAILTGDALNSLGFGLLAKLTTKVSDPFLHRDLLDILHDGAGAFGMISGQMKDILLEKDSSLHSEANLSQMHSKKTGALILASMLLGNRLKEDWKLYETSIRVYAIKLGLLFQITDDILDVESSFESIGKTPGKDANHGKLTYPKLFGMDKTKIIRDQLCSELYEISTKLEDDTNFFHGLAFYIANRKN